MISVVIPLYNKQTSITTTLQSVLNQTYSDYEIIIVDDGSTDESVSKVLLLIQTNLHAKEKIRLIRKSNRGVSSARNEGIKRAKSDFVAFLDADDFWEPTYLETQVQMIADFPDAKMWGTAWGKMVGNQKYPGKGVRIADNFRGYVEEYFLNRMYLYCSSSVVINKQIFREIDMFDERISCGEDIDLWWRIILHYPVAYINESLAYYRQDAENRITLSHPKIEKHFIYFADKYQAFCSYKPSFKNYAQREILGQLYPYFLEDRNNIAIRKIIKQMDFNELPFSYRLRYFSPFLYTLYLRFKI